MVKEPPQVGHELLDTPALPGGRGTEAVAEVDDPEARVPRLVAKDEPEDVTHQWIGTVVLEHLEDPDRDALEEDLHADDLLAVVVGLEESVDELLEWRVDGRFHAQLLQVTAEHLHVACFVDHLPRETEPGLDLGHHIQQLRTERERGLLAHEELRESEGAALRAHTIEVLA